MAVSALLAVFSAVSFGDKGEIISIRQSGDGRELIRVVRPMVSAEFADGTSADANAARVGSDGVWRYSFSGRNGMLGLRQETFFGGISFKVVSCDLENVDALVLCQVNPVCTKYVGELVNGLSDDESGVVVRAYDVSTQMRVSLTGLSLHLKMSDGVVGKGFGLSAGARGAIPQMLKGMTLAAGIAHSCSGGAWSIGSEENRSSFFMVRDPSADTIDDWIDCARLCGCTTLHIDWWWEPHKGEGHYPVRRDRFPRGEADLRDASLKAHAAGLRTDTHTLSGCIGFSDSWVTPHASSNLMHIYRYTLSRSVGREDKVIYVNEMPGDRHDFSVDYFSNGNVLRVGTELMQYDGIVREKPYAFTGVRRGAFGTEVFAHREGETVDYLWQHYLSFFADPYSPLADEMAKTLGENYSRCGFDQVYFDGAEGVADASIPPDEQGRDLMLRKFFTALAAGGKAPQWEDSTWTAHGWWFHSRIGSWDYSSWAPRAFVDRHLRFILPQSRLCNFMEPSLGWWPINWGSDNTPIFHLDEQEYFAAKMVGADSAFSIVPWTSESPGQRPFPVGMRRQMTVIGQYERFRLARAFADGVSEKLAEPDADFRLRQDETGEWTLTPVDVQIHRVGGSDYAHWMVKSATECETVALRVEALYGAGSWGGDHRKALDADDAGKMMVTNAPGVGLCVSASATDGIVLRATNATASATGAWAGAVLKFRHPYTDRDFTGCMAYGLKVRGDGSGAILNLQTVQGRDCGEGINEHYIRIDFEGWRYFEIPMNPEHDAGAFNDLVWPYAQYPSASVITDRGIVKPKGIGSISLWLNEIPAGGATCVAVGEVRALPMIELELDAPCVVVGARKFRVPFSLKSGEFAELEGGFWTKYSIMGDPVGRCAEKMLPILVAGANEVFVDMRSRQASPRADVTVFAFGKPFRALSQVLSGQQERMLDWEPVLPDVWAPGLGFDRISPIKVRPGRNAFLDVEIVGPIDHPVLTVGDDRLSFPVKVAADEKLVCSGGSWVVRRPRGRTGASGKIDGGKKVISGVVPVSLSSGDEATSCAQIRFFKRYCQ